MSELQVRQLTTPTCITFFIAVIINMIKINNHEIRNNVNVYRCSNCSYKLTFFCIIITITLKNL